MPWAVPVPPLTTKPPTSFVISVPVLMYHRIVPFSEAGPHAIVGLIVPPSTFSAQLDALKKAGWSTITLAQLAEDLDNRVRPARRTIVITIDDGWYDGFKYAYPILVSHGYVATYFVIGARIDGSNQLTSADLRELVAAGDEIGDHTMDHLRLTSQKSTKLSYEIDAGAARIAQVTGHWPETLSYPMGKENSAVLAAVAACQPLRMAVMEKGLKLPERGPVSIQAYETWNLRYQVPRYRITPGTGPATLLSLIGP